MVSDVGKPVRLRLLLITAAEDILTLVRHAAGQHFMLLSEQDSRQPDVIVFDATVADPEIPRHVGTLRSRYPGVVVVVLVSDGRSALLVLKDLIVDEAVSLPSGAAELSGALLAAVSRCFLDGLAATLEHDASCDPVVSHALAFALRARPALAGEKKWRACLNVSHATFWRHWSRLLAGGPAPREFLHAVALMRFVNGLQRGLSPGAALSLQSYSGRTVERLAKQMFGQTLAQLARDAAPLKEWLAAAIQRVLPREGSGEPI